MRFTSLWGYLLFLGIFAFAPAVNAQLPPDFNDQIVVEGGTEITGFTFDDSGRMYMWEKAGLVYVWEKGIRQDSPLLDIREEVGNWRDHGLLGFTLDPYFLENGYFYVLYAVDRHHLLYAGTPDYDPLKSESYQASIGRITRYTADPNADFQQVIPGSRKIVLGQDLTDGIPLLHESHGVGSLVFGTDGSLLASCGDGGTYLGNDVGQGGDFGTYAQQALEDGIITPDQDVGAFRAQSIHSLSGKVLRINPQTGAGIPSNPFYEPDAPRAPQSRVWALGFRNPFRMVLQPETGSHALEDARPGVLLIGDNGWGSWEEVDVVDRPGQNFGWPMFEGIRNVWGYYSKPTPNLRAPNPLATDSLCERPYFYYQDLLKQTRTNSDTLFANACDLTQLIPDIYPRFYHTRPVLEYKNQDNPIPVQARVPGFDDQGYSTPIVLEEQTQVAGQSFEGTSSISGAFYTGEAFPEPYRNTYFHSDYGGKWIRQLVFDENQQLQSVKPFHEAAGAIVNMETHPIDGCLYYVNYPSEIRKICYGGNVPPVAKIDVDRYFGTSPLTVSLSAKNAYDPEGSPLSYRWLLGDGNSSTEAEFTHTFHSTNSGAQSFEVLLEVRDSLGDIGTASQVISLNNTPPLVEISSIVDRSYFNSRSGFFLPLKATVQDAEHSPEEMHYEWQTFLHHNTHFHPEPIDERIQTQTYLSPVGCGDETYWYRFRLTVTDPAGLSGIDEKELFPDCLPLPEIHSFTGRVQEDGILLSWDSFGEVEMQHYLIQRGDEQGSLYVSIDSLPAQNQADASYQFKDFTPHMGIYQYRIQGVNKFGSFVRSASLPFKYPKDLYVNVFPNPSHTEFQVRFFSYTGQVHWQLLDYLGRRVAKGAWQVDPSISYPIEVDDLQAGLFLFVWEHNSRRGVVKIKKE